MTSHRLIAVYLGGRGNSMKTCPNCGRLTSRTTDWACQWCGFPLFSKSYKTVPMTYSEAKGETPGEEKPPAPGVELVPEPELEPAPEPEPVSEAELEPAPEPEPKPAAEAKPKPTSKPKAKVKPKPRPKPQPKAEAEPEPAEPEPSEGVLSVDELYSRLERDKAAAEAKFLEQSLKVTGLVHRTVINENLTVAYVMLASAQGHEERQVTCTFDKEHEEKIGRLTQGDRVTVEGAYDGYAATVMMKDCVLV